MYQFRLFFIFLLILIILAPMKIMLVLVFMLVSFLAKTQVREEIFDYQFRPNPSTAYYFVVTEKKDSLWERKAYFLSERSLYMEGWYKDDSCKIGHGTFRWYHANRRLSSTVQYSEGKREGLLLSYHENGMLQDSVHYSNGHKKGIGLSFHENGYQADSSNFDGKGNGAQVIYYDDGSPSAAGYWTRDTLKKGRWKYFHRNGAVMATEDYSDEGKKILFNCYDENGVRLDSSVCELKPASIDPRVWQDLLKANLFELIDQKSKEGISGRFTVLLRFVVNEDGSLEDLVPLTHHGYGIEEEVVKIFTKAPKWSPGRLYGKPVRSYHTQPISIIISE